MDRLKHMLPDQEWTQDAKPLMFLDLKLGNICNLKCRICGSWSSSQFAAEEIAWTPREEQKKTSAYQMLRAGAWPRENTQFWSQINSVIDDIRYIEFTGGEPFMIQEHFRMLQGIVDRGIAHQVEIHYNTNGTHFPEQAVEIWKHFKTVEIAISIDDIGSRFEYQRTNAVWSEVEENVARFHSLRHKNPNIQLQCCSTVNVFNIRYIDRLAHWIASQQFDFVYWNIMHDAWYFSIATLPDEVKQDLDNYLSTARIPERFDKDFQGIRDFMNNGASTDGFMLRMKIADLDRKRDQDFAQVSPEMAELIEYVKT
jgi:MoaA/NifB/PqqE/SkfB family radical SAM enzyme